MSELATVWVLMCLAAIILFFYEMRLYAEKAKIEADKYCDQNRLQLVSIHRTGWKPIWNNKSGPGIQSRYQLAFSSTGENLVVGEIILKNRRLQSIEVPPYQI